MQLRHSSGGSGTEEHHAEGFSALLMDTSAVLMDMIGHWTSLADPNQRGNASEQTFHASFRYFTA